MPRAPGASPDHRNADRRSPSRQSRRGSESFPTTSRDIPMPVMRLAAVRRRSCCRNSIPVLVRIRSAAFCVVPMGPVFVGFGNTHGPGLSEVGSPLGQPGLAGSMPPGERLCRRHQSTTVNWRLDWLGTAPDSLREGSAATLAAGRTCRDPRFHLCFQPPHSVRGKLAPRGEVSLPL